jgi:hypothetical protein
VRVRACVRMRQQRTSIGLGTIDAGESATAEVTVLPRPRAQPLATAQQNEYELILSLSSDEVRGIYATQIFAPKPAAAASEEGVPPSDGEEEAAASEFVHNSGYLVAGKSASLSSLST